VTCHAAHLKNDLSRLFDLARGCLDDMLARNKTGKFRSSDHGLMACLCQGAAQHFVHGDRGVSDWDVVFFFPTQLQVPSATTSPVMPQLQTYQRTSIGAASGQERKLAHGLVGNTKSTVGPLQTSPNLLIRMR
jgi:hypothetical protein